MTVVAEYQTGRRSIQRGQPRASLLLLAALTGLAVAGCGASTTPEAPGLPDDTAQAQAPTPADEADRDTAQASRSLPRAPWSGPVLAPDEVPAAYLTARGEAENREWCALMAFHDPPAGRANVDPTVRTAQFGGGWAVAYDLPELRSAFGVAGTGVEPGPDTYDDWPYRVRWHDGSRAGYGPEGGSGPKQLAYLRVQGQRCLYNVWSHLGREHLETLLEDLRFVGPLFQTHE